MNEVRKEIRQALREQLIQERQQKKQDKKQKKLDRKAERRERNQKNRLPKETFNAILADDSEMMKEKSLQLGDDFSLFSVFVFI